MTDAFDASQPGVRVVRDRNPAGEFSFTATGLFLSLHLGHYLRLEQRTTDRLWSGSSVRGDVKVILPGEPRTFRHLQPARFAHLTIAPARLAAGGIDMYKLRPHVILRDPVVRHLIEAMLAETSEGRPSRLFEDAVTQALASRLLSLDGRREHSPQHGLSRQQLARVMEILEADLARNWSVMELAQAVELGRSQFAALFRESTGEPPHRYVTRRRVERAREHMLGGASASDAALAVGFYDQSHLAKQMRRVLGVTPAPLRRSR